MSNTVDAPYQSTSFPTAIPLIVGVTGHRDLFEDDVPQIKRLVREALLTLKNTYPHTPLVLLSPLVEGADQLVAEVALEPDIGARLLAVLCWPLEFSFGGKTEAVSLARGGDVARFTQLLDQATNVVTMPLDDESRSLAATSPAAFEERQYELVGKFMARHSQALIALWDGQAPESSGTAQVVAWQQNGAPAPFAAQLGELDVIEGAPIYHIPVRRKSRPAATTVSELSAPKYLYPASAETSEQESQEQIHRAWGNIDRFNRDVAELRKSSPGLLDQSRSWLLTEEKGEVTARLSPPLLVLREFYALADAAAMQFQAKIDSIVRWMFIAGPAALVFLEAYAHKWEHWGLLVAYLVVLGLGYCLFDRTRRREIDGRYLDARALAEALRVQFFWNWSGLKDCAADHYLRHLRGELGWARQAARTCFLLIGDAVPATPQYVPGTLESLRTVRTQWVEAQRKYFERAARKNEEKEEHYELLAKCSFGFAALVALVELVCHWKTGHLNHWLILLTFFGLVSMAMIEKFAEYKAYGIHARQYAWMKNLFAAASSKLESHTARGNVAGAQQLLHDLGLEALNENADWLVQRRRKPVKLPK